MILQWLRLKDVEKAPRREVLRHGNGTRRQAELPKSSSASKATTGTLRAAKTLRQLSLRPLAPPRHRPSFLRAMRPPRGRCRVARMAAMSLRSPGIRPRKRRSEFPGKFQGFEFPIQRSREPVGPGRSATCRRLIARQRGIQRRQRQCAPSPRCPHSLHSRLDTRRRAPRMSPRGSHVGSLQSLAGTVLVGVP